MYAENSKDSKQNLLNIQIGLQNFGSSDIWSDKSYDRILKRVYQTAIYLASCHSESSSHFVCNHSMRTEIGTFLFNSPPPGRRRVEIAFCITPNVGLPFLLL